MSTSPGTDPLCRSRAGPEELIAAAQSSCYSAQLSHMIGEAGGTPNQIDTTAVVTLIVGEGITKIGLTCRASVDGMDEAAFQQTVANGWSHSPLANTPRSRSLGRVETGERTRLMVSVRASVRCRRRPRGARR
ncbi:MAG TPA: OsmC family protein [Pseudonocardiaceae bacterium]|nr:OsmC family protein [Pseudonocardiaceae bacterium]